MKNINRVGLSCISLFVLLSACSESGNLNEAKTSKKTPPPEQIQKKPARKKFGAFLKILDYDSEASGQVLFIEQRGQPNFQIAKYDFSTRQHTTIFKIPSRAWVHQLNTGTSTSELILSYSPPPTNTDTKKTLNGAGIYSLNLNHKESQPTLIWGPAEPRHSYYDPIISQDGQYIYFVLVKPTREDNNRFSNTIMRYTVGTEKTEVLAENGIWPQLNQSNQSLIYMHVSPQSQKRSLKQLNLENGEQVVLIEEDRFNDIDLPTQSANNQSIYFSVINQPTLSWLSAFSPISTAIAHGNHNQPADWWSIKSHKTPTEAATFNQLTNIDEVMYYGQISPNKRYLGMATKTGFSIHDLQQKKTTPILKSRAFRMFTWLP